MRSSIRTVLRALFAALLVVPTAARQGTPVGYEEQFALALDREAVLEQLIPGTPDYYFYHCLHRQNSGALEEVPALLNAWIARHGSGERVAEIENRQALLTFDANPGETYDFLSKRLNLRFEHRQEQSGAAPDLPTELDPQLIARETLTERALRNQRRAVSGFEDSALPFLVEHELDATWLRSLLGRLTRPDVPKLAELVVRDLRASKSGGFGSLGIHERMLLEQLDECAERSPELLNHSTFIETYLKRLEPSADVDWTRDVQERTQYLSRLEAFAERLTPAHNSLKALVLYRRLAHDLVLGVPDKERFMRYLQLPRPSAHVNPDYLKDPSARDNTVNLKMDYATDLGSIGDDGPIVRAYLEHFFQTENNYAPYLQTLRTEYVERLFAETKILAGVGDMERWYTLLDDPTYYERLKERVDIEFPVTQQAEFGANEPVQLTLDVKNVATLLVKVFEINTLNYYAAEEREVDASLNVDGLVANEETLHIFEENPLRRVRRTFDFPSLAKPGVYIVEFVGNGVSSRAVVRKGRLTFTERVGAAGHVLQIFDDDGGRVRDAAVRVSGREYAADERGEVLIPFTNQPGQRALILRSGNFATLESFHHTSEQYRLDAGIGLAREALLAGETAKVIVRPRLYLGSVPVSIELLEEPTLMLHTLDVHGVSAVVPVRDLELFEDRESVHEIRVPEGLVSLRVSLTGKVENLSRGETEQVDSTQKTFSVNAIEGTSATSSPLLGRTPQGYVLDLLGKNGEPKADRPVALRLKHKDFKETVNVTLKTDANGRIRLGELADIGHLEADGFDGRRRGWPLQTQARNYPERLHGVAGEILRLPLLGGAPDGTHDASLLEFRGLAFAFDRSDHLAVEGGFLEMRDLEPGDYNLWLPRQGVSVGVSVTAGRKQGAWAFGGSRALELKDESQLHIVDMRVEGEDFIVQLAGVEADARVHVFASRYLPTFDSFANLRAPWQRSPGTTGVSTTPTSYHSGRAIGDEYRYILDRRYAKKYPGNMLRRPGLLLNPWAIDVFDDVIGIGGGASGGKFGKRMRKGGRGDGPASLGTSASPTANSAGAFPSLEFLPGPAPALANLKPEAGVVRMPLSQLGDGQLVHVVAIDRSATAYSSHALPEKPLERRERALSPALDPERHLTEQRSIEFVNTGATAVLADIATSTAETYDTLESVHQFFTTLTGNADLVRFDFILGWPNFTAEEKNKLYSEHACHELNFFLHEKDPEFFEAVIRGYLANKIHRTFLDRWLLGEDLSSFLDPWAFARLNVVERILLTRAVADASPRYFEELLELRPENRDWLESLFEFALKGKALSVASAGGIASQLSSAKEELARAESSVADEMAESRPVGDEPQPQTHGGSTTGEDAWFLGHGQKSQDAERRDNVRSLYQPVGRTRAYVEHNYWQRGLSDQGGGMIAMNAFWLDFAEASADELFVSPNFVEASSSFAEMMLALAVLDLPFEGGGHRFTIGGSRLSMQAQSPLLFVRKELRDAPLPESTETILISQNFYRLDDRYRHEDGERRDKFIDGEFLVDVPYGVQVVLTNPTSAPKDLELLLQIPEGSIPVQKGHETRGIPARIGAYGTSVFETAFYFPAPLDAVHYPAHVSESGDLIAFADPVRLNVVAESSERDTTSWAYVSQRASVAELIEYLNAANLKRIELERIAWRMRDREVFETIIALLRDRHAYNDTLWSYGMLHRDALTSREYLRHKDDLLDRCGRWIDSVLVKLDPIERRSYQHIEYEPLVNARAHRFGDERRIASGSVASQYASLTNTLCYRPALDDLDWMSVTYYLLLQDRIEEALACFARVDGRALPTRVQYDYMNAYLQFFSETPEAARFIALPYRQHPVERWRARFGEVIGQLDEAQGAETTVSDPQDRDQNQGALAMGEPAVDLSVEAQQVNLSYHNLEEVEVSYYEMDVEFLFSTSPFVQDGSGSFTYVRPNRSDRIPLPAEGSELSLPLPEEFQNSNVLVEVHGSGVSASQPYYSGKIAAQLIENYGQVKVTHAETRAPLSRVYVKVFAQTANGDVRFHKDGYTDLRGRFDYASVSGKISPAERYAILVLSEPHGALIREAAPPAQ